MKIEFQVDLPVVPSVGRQNRPRAATAGHRGEGTGRLMSSFSAWGHEGSKKGRATRTTKKMKYKTQLIIWHDKEPVLSCDLEPFGKKRLATAGGDGKVRVSYLIYVF
jgi:hypothetical protein